MKKTVLAVSIVAVLSLPLFAAPQKRAATPAASSAPAYIPPAGNGLAGKSGIGAGVNGIGYRYWTTDESAWDLNFGFASAKDTKSLEFGGQYLTLLRQRGGLRFMSMFGLQYGNTSTDLGAITVKQTDITLGAGLNVEYFFTELPDLGFNATLTGIQIDLRSADAGGGSTSSTNIATVPVVNFGVRYYYK